MNLARDIAKELVGMFIVDVRLSISILVLVPIAWALAGSLSLLLAGGMLAIGCLAVLVGTVTRQACERIH